MITDVAVDIADISGIADTPLLDGPHPENDFHISTPRCLAPPAAFCYATII
jgi:hypothetical protein